MSIMNHLLEIERKIGPFAFEAKKTDDNIVLQYRNLLRSLKWKKEDELRELEKALEKIEVENEKIYSKHLPKIMQAINEAKKSPGVDSLDNLHNVLEEYEYDYNDNYSEIWSIVTKIIKYCEEVTSDQEKINEVDRILKQWEQRSSMIPVHKIVNLVDSDIKLLRAKKSDGFLSNIFRKRPKKIFNEKIGKANIFLDLRCGFDIDRDTINDRKIRSLINNQIDGFISRADQTSKENELYNWFLKVKEKSKLEIEEGILNIVFNTIVHVLKNNSGLIRASRANIYVKILPENVIDYKGAIILNKSSASNIFLEIKLTQPYITFYIYNIPILSPNTDEYDTIVHELTHAFDWRLNTDPATEDLVREMIGKDPLPETIEVASTLSMLRSEGLAELSGFLNSKRSMNMGKILFSIDDFEPDENVRREISEAFSESASLDADINDIGLKLGSLRRSRTCYDFGRHMIIVILIFSLKNRLSFWLCGNDNMREKVIEEYGEGHQKIESIVEKYGWKEIPASKINKYFKRGSGLNFQINEDDYPYVDQFITKLSLMTTPDFFRGYLNACKDLGIDPSPITPEEFIRFDKDKEHQINKLRKKMGF